MANHRPVSLLPQSRAPIISIQIIFPEDAGNRDELPPVRQGGAELAGCLKVTLQSAIDFEIDIVFEGSFLSFSFSFFSFKYLSFSPTLYF